MRMRCCLWLWLFGALFLTMLPRVASAQFYNGSQMEFGRKRVQYRDFVWFYNRYERFDTYFYRGGEMLANHAAAYTDAYIEEIEQRLETRIDDKLIFIVYNTLDDLKQSNIGYMTGQQYNTGGITHILDNKVFLYFDGDITHFEQQIRAGIARVLIDQMTQGGSVGSQIKNATLKNFPSWYIDGLVSFLSIPWSTEMDDRAKDNFLSGRFRRFNHLRGEDARLAGHSLWFFIAATYGESVIPDIVFLSKMGRNTQVGFSYVLDLSFKNLINQWEAFYNDRYRLDKNTSRLPESTLLKEKPNKHFVYNRVRVSPGGRYLAYSYNEAGKYVVYLKDLATGKRKRVLSRGNRLNEKVDETYPLLAWHPSGALLSIVTIEKGVVRLYFYHVEEREKERINLVNYQQVLDISYSPDGSKLLLSAVKRGHSDLFIYDIASGSNMQLTNDVYNDLHPRFVDGMSRILFASNRVSDTLLPSMDSLKGLGLRPANDLFLMDYPFKGGTLRRITRTPHANETAPLEVGRGQYLFLSDASGVTNRYVVKVDSTLAYVDTIAHYRYASRSYPVSDYSRGVHDYHYDPRSGMLAEILFHDQRYYTYYGKSAQQFGEKGLTNTVYMDEVLRKEEEEGGKKTRKRDRKHFVSVYEPDRSPGLPLYDRWGEGKGTDSLSAETPFLVTPDSLLFAPEPRQDLFKPEDKRNYYVQFSLNEMVTQVDFNSLNYTYQQFSGGGSPIYLNTGFNIFTQIGVTDVLEDYRIIGGVKLGGALTNNEYILNYADLSGQLDKELILHRKADFVYLTGGSSYGYAAKFRNHELLYKLSYPLNRVLYVAATGILRSDKIVYPATSPQELVRPNVVRNWAGLKGELVFDNSYKLMDNILLGTRFKLFGEYYQLVDNTFHNLYVWGFDYRRYDRIHRTLIWANRLSGSSSFGTDRLIYYMGGVNNWIGARFDTHTPVSDETHYVYQTLATNMHGFDQNIRNGNTFLLFNSEVRWPLFQYLINRPISGEFLKNFQIVGFCDVGTAWTGLSPYSDENALYREEYEDGTLRVIVNVQKEPIVAGYGLGVRTRLLGYFVRLDCSWGVQDQEILPAKWYFGLGLDF